MHGAELTSTRSPRVTAARRLTKRAFRAAARHFLAEGPQAVREALAAGGVSELFATSDAASRHPELIDSAGGIGVPVHRVSGEVLTALTQTVTPQGMVAVCRFLDAPLDAVLSHRPALVALLANVRDPGNAGTVIRVADAAGADAVVITEASVDIYNGKCVRASAGSIFHLPVVVGVSAAGAVDALRACGLRVVAADGSGVDLDRRVESGVLAKPTVWMFGNEAWGMPEELLALADDVVRVPIYGRAESLNLAAAAAVCLYATARFQRTSRGNSHDHGRSGPADTVPTSP